MRIKNICGTSQKYCECGSWMKHWNNYSAQTVAVCRVRGCLRTDVIGAHVQKDVDNDDAWYIAPICNKHNFAKGSLELIEGTDLVPADLKLTCEQ